MKKSLFIMTMAALALTSCSNDDVRNDIEENLPIDFAGYAEKGTRASIENNKELADAGGFLVWGYKTPTVETLDWEIVEANANKATTIFNEVNVTSSGDDGEWKEDANATNWTYSPKRYWDRNATYRFYAAAPNSTKVSISADNADAKKIIVTDAASAKAASAEDFLICREGVGRVGTTTTDVEFTFHHIMARVEVEVKRSAEIADGATFTLNSLTMTGWNGKTGTFTQTLTATPGTLSHTEWAMTAGTAGEVTWVGADAGDVTKEIPNGINAQPLTDKWIMVPQTVAANGLTFTANYTIEQDSYSETFETKGTLEAAQVWGTDSKTIYTLTIGPKPIEFDVVQVTDWTNKPTPTLDF